MNNSDCFEYVCSQVKNIESLSYFENIKKYPSGSFLLGVYNFVSVIKEHNLHIAVTMTKVIELESNIKILAKILYENTCVCNSSVGNSGVDNCSISEQFENFLNQFKDKNYPETYYKKFSAVLPVDKLSNDLCQIVLDKNWIHTIASLATFELILSKISIKFNSYAKVVNSINSNIDFLNVETGENNCLQLLKIIDDGHGQSGHIIGDDIVSGVTETIAIFESFFNEINNQFYCD